MLKKLILFSTFSFLAIADQNIYFEGDVKVNGKPITKTSKITSGDIVQTSKNSKIKFNIGKDAFIAKGKSKFTLKKTNTQKVLEVIDGGVVAVFNGDGKHSIETKNMTAGIRGTGTYTLVKDNKTYFCTCYGETELKSKSTHKSLALKTHHHKMVWVTKDSIKNAMTMEGHSDSDLYEAEHFVNSSPDFRK